MEIELPGGRSAPLLPEPAESPAPDAGPAPATGTPADCAKPEHDGWPTAALPSPRWMARGLSLAALLVGSVEPLVVDGKRIEGAPPGSTVRYTHTDTETEPAVDQRASATGDGAGMTTSAAEAAGSFNAGAPDTALGPLPGQKGPGARSSGGKAGAAFELKGMPAGMNFFHMIGGAALLAAGAMFVFIKPPPRQLALSTAALGALSIAVGVLIQDYPWAWLALAAGIIGYAVYVVVHERGDSAAKAALGDTVEAVETLPPALAKPVKSAVSALQKLDGAQTERNKAIDRAKRGRGVMRRGGASVSVPIAPVSSESLRIGALRGVAPGNFPGTASGPAPAANAPGLSADNPLVIGPRPPQA